MELQLEIIPAQSQRRGEPAISFNRKSGLISLSRDATISLKIQEGDRLAIAKDPANHKNWYLLHLSSWDDHLGLPCRVKSGAGAALNCTAWTQAFMEEFALKEKLSLRVPLGTKPNEILEGRAKAYAILTKALEL